MVRCAAPFRYTPADPREPQTMTRSPQYSTTAATRELVATGLADGLTFAAIAERLNDAGLRTRQGRAFDRRRAHEHAIWHGLYAVGQRAPGRRPVCRPASESPQFPQGSPQ